MEIKSVILIALIIFEIAMSSYLAYKDLKGAPQVCMIGHSCEDVQNSQYGQILGIKLPFIAIVAFLSLLIVYFMNPRLFTIGTYIGALCALALILLQALVLKEFCANCMIIDVTMFIILIVSFLKF